jgi:hypothetical protein
MSDSVMVPKSALADLELVAGEIFERWDKDMRSGKLLTALSGLMAPGYDPRVDRIRQALAASTPVGCWEDISSLARQMMAGKGAMGAVVDGLPEDVCELHADNLNALSDALDAIDVKSLHAILRATNSGAT